MRNKWLAAVLMAALLLGACGKSAAPAEETAEPVAEETADVTEAPAEEYEEEYEEDYGYEEETDPFVDDDNTPIVPETVEEAGIDAFVEIPDYEGIPLTRTYSVITDEDAELEISYMLESYPMVLPDDTVAEEGMFATVDYEGTVDGEVVEDLSGNGLQVRIGGGYFYIEGFEEQLIGHKVGEELSFPLTIPEEYYYEEFAGKEIQYEVKITQLAHVLEEPTDEWTKENTTYESVEDMRANLKDDLQKEADTETDNQLRWDAFDAVMSTASFKQYPQDMYDGCYANVEEQMRSSAEMYDMTLEEFLEENMVTTDYISSQAKYDVRTKLVLYYIFEKEGRQMDGPEYDEMMAHLLDTSEFESEEEILQSGVSKEYLESSVLTMTAASFILEKANIEEVEYEPEVYDEDLMLYEEDEAVG